MMLDLQQSQGIRIRLYLAIDIPGYTFNIVSRRFSARLVMLVRRMELHCNRHNRFHTSLSLIKAWSRYKW